VVSIVSTALKSPGQPPHPALRAGAQRAAPLHPQGSFHALRVSQSHMTNSYYAKGPRFVPGGRGAGSGAGGRTSGGWNTRGTDASQRRAINPILHAAINHLANEVLGIEIMREAELDPADFIEPAQLFLA
jgi:hypothetical protein